MKDTLVRMIDTRARMKDTLVRMIDTRARMKGTRVPLETLLASDTLVRMKDTGMKDTFGVPCFFYERPCGPARVPIFGVQFANCKNSQNHRAIIRKIFTGHNEELRLVPSPQSRVFSSSE